MSAKTFILALAAAGLAASPVAASASELAGTLSMTSGQTFVARGGSLLTATPSMQLYKGDRVVTGANGSAKVAVSGGCNLAVGASSMSSVSSCDAKNVDFARAGYDANGSSLRGSAGGFIVAILAAAAVIVGIVIVIDNDDDSPASP